MAEGGRGIDLIGHYADSVEYSQHSTGGLNVSISIDRKKVQQTIQKLSEDNMEMIVREKGPVTVVQLSGRLDLASGSSLKEQVKKLLAKNETTVHLNLAHVEFINSSGLGALVSIMKEVRLAKGRLTLSNLASYVQEIFDITQLSHIFEIYSTEEEALASFQAASVR
jgi:anti-sigma B factor antagonist